MVIGSLAIWLGSPFFWLWLTSKLQSGTQATMGPYVLMLVGLVLSSVLIGKGLGLLNRRYAALDPNNGEVRIHLPWHRMLGGEHEVRSVPVTILDVIMVISVMVAVLLLVVWFFVVQPTPPGLQPGPAKH
jgi:hypothetical protein